MTSDASNPDEPVNISMQMTSKSDPRQKPATRHRPGDGDFTRDFEDLPLAMLRISENGKVLQSNSLARNLLGIEADERLELCDLVEGPGCSVSVWLEQAKKQGSGRKPEVVMVKRSNGGSFVQVSFMQTLRVLSTDFILVLLDASELKALEAQICQSQKMQTIGQLAGGIAHDFNNLLTSITGYCDLLLLRHKIGDRDHKELSQISQNAGRAATLVAQLLAFSRKQTLLPDVIEIRAVLEDLVQLLNRLLGERCTLSFTHGTGLPRVKVDVRQIEQVIMNLVINARDAMPEGGVVHIETLSVAFDDNCTIDGVLLPAGAYLCLKVTDTGVGIDAKNLPKVFEPFFTTKPPDQGTGLGLSTVYGIVKQTGGFVFAKSSVAQGSVFTIYLPAHIGDAEASPEATKPETPLKNILAESIAVLLVEDEISVREFAARSLRLYGYTVYEADCAEAALTLLADPDLKIDTIVSDVVMPGLDGPTWVRKALESRPETKVIFISGYAKDNFAKFHREIRSATFLSKPFTLQRLVQAVQSEDALATPILS